MAAKGQFVHFSGGGQRHGIDSSDQPGNHVLGKLSGEVEAHLRELVGAKPDATLAELREALAGRAQVKASTSTVDRAFVSQSSACRPTAGILPLCFQRTNDESP